jgi:hypothetical protein
MEVSHMMKVLVVQEVDSNPLIVFDAGLVDDSMIEDETRRMVQDHNARSAVQAEGALIWSVDGEPSTFEFFAADPTLRPHHRPQVENLHGTYETHDGRKFKYYGKCVWYTWRTDAYWEVRVFHHDKQLKYDGVLDSKDGLATLRGPLLNWNLEKEVMLALARGEVGQKIEATFSS